MESNWCDWSCENSWNCADFKKKKKKKKREEIFHTTTGRAIDLHPLIQLIVSHPCIVGNKYPKKKRGIKKKKKKKKAALFLLKLESLGEELTFFIFSRRLISK